MGIARSPGRQYEKNDHEHHRLSVFHGAPLSRASPWGQMLAIFWLPAPPDDGAMAGRLRSGAGAVLPLGALE